MKNVLRIFSACLCSVSLFAFDAVAAVATTAGSNLTAYNPSNAYNNQWATMSNGRNDVDSVSAKADFGNCNALIMRCAQPKCGNGGCSDLMVASSIVSGCVQSNSQCKQYGDNLVQYMSAQLVASSTAKVNAANAEQMAAQTAAAQQAAAAQQQQMVEMQNQMQQQMAAQQQQMQQMQQQMAEQSAQSAQQIAAALAQSQQQQQQAISDMQAAAQNAARAEVAGGMAVTQRDEVAIEKGVSAEVMEREKITGQILTEIEDAQNALKEVKVAMEAAFTYAGCDTRGDNCTGPKRVKKWRELASAFIDPYDTVVNKLDDALTTAQLVGADMSEIYMMLNDSCNSWGEYLCPPNGTVHYNPPAQQNENGTSVVENKGAPRVCSKSTLESIADWNSCQPCTLLKILNNKDDVYQGWIEADNTTNENRKVVACASSALAGSKLFSRKAKAKSGAGVIDIDFLDRWINQRESGDGCNTNSALGTCEVHKYCYGGK